MYKGPIIDCHTHLFDETSLTDYLKEFNTDMFLCLNFFKGFANGEFDNRIESFFDFISQHKNLYAIPCIDVEDEQLNQLKIFEANLKLYGQNKIKGMKLYPGYQHFYPQEKRLNPIYEFCEEHNLPVIFHSGAFYQFKGSRSLVKFSAPIHIDEVAVNYPNVNFIISHFGFPNMDDAALTVAKNHNVFTDISGVIDNPTACEAYLKDLKRIMLYYPEVKDKVMFGTDFISGGSSLSEVRQYAQIVYEIFDEEQQKKVFYETAKNLYHL